MDEETRKENQEPGGEQMPMHDAMELMPVRIRIPEEEFLALCEYPGSSSVNNTLAGPSTKNEDGSGDVGGDAGADGEDADDEDEGAGDGGAGGGNAVVDGGHVGVAGEDTSAAGGHVGVAGEDAGADGEDARADGGDAGADGENAGAAGNHACGRACDDNLPGPSPYLRVFKMEPKRSVYQQYLRKKRARRMSEGSRPISAPVVPVPRPYGFLDLRNRRVPKFVGIVTRMNDYFGMSECPMMGIGACSMVSTTLYPAVIKPPDKEEVQKEIRRKKIEKRVKLERTKGDLFEGTYDPIALFPEELWGLIITELSSLDKLNLCRTNSQLDAMFGQSKSQWLLDQVLPFLMPYFSKKREILTLRMVCKDWRNVVTKLLESEHPHRRPYNKNHLIEKLNSTRPSVYSSLRRVHLEHIPITPATSRRFDTCIQPVGRAVAFHVNGSWDDETVEDFWNRAKEFLSSGHGAEIWHFKFVQYNLHLTTIRFYRILQECLTYLGNLRTLEIRCHLDRDQLSLDRTLVQIIEEYPLPPLPNLHSVEIEGVPRVFKEHVVNQYSSQLEKLSMNMDIHSENEKFPVNINELILKRVGHGDIPHKIDNMTEYSVPSNCTKLTLDMSLSSRVHGRELVETLKKFPNLVHLRIVLHSRTSYFSIGSYCAWGQYQHSSIEYFEIEGDGRDLFNFSSLLHAFPALEYLHVRDTYYAGDNVDRPGERCNGKEESGVEIEEWLYRGKMHMSPIWDTLPELRVFTFESVNGTMKVACDRETVDRWKERQMKQMEEEEKKKMKDKEGEEKETLQEDEKKETMKMKGDEEKEENQEKTAEENNAEGADSMEIE